MLLGNGSWVGWIPRGNRGHCIKSLPVATIPSCTACPILYRCFNCTGEEVVPEHSIETIASSPLCHNQIAALGPAAYGLQGHMELDQAMVERWFAEDDDLRPIAHQAQFNQAGLEALMPVGQRLYGNWLSLAAQQLAPDQAVANGAP